MKMKRWMSGAGALLVLGMFGGCGNGSDSTERVAVSFGDGTVEISLQSISIEQTATGTSIRAEVISDLPEAFTFEGMVESSGVFNVSLHNGAELSQSIRMDATELEMEFMRPTWLRTDSMAFEDATAMSQWLQFHRDEGTASCAGVPDRYRDLPLYFATKAILEHLVSNHDVAIDTTRMEEILCAQTANQPNESHTFAPGIAGWEALVNGEYIYADLPMEVPLTQDALSTEKNTCAREEIDLTLDAEYETTSLYVRPTTMDITCNDAVLELNANCCVDEELKTNTHGRLRKYALPAQSQCHNVFTPSGRSGGALARFRFTGHASACPKSLGTDSCWAGRNDEVTPFSCEITGYDDATGNFDPIITSTPTMSNGVAAWAYMMFDVKICYEKGDDLDVIRYHDRRVDLNRSPAAICGPGAEENCFCGPGI